MFDVVFYLITDDANAGNKDDYVVWKNLRLEGAGKPPPPKRRCHRRRRCKGRSRGACRRPAARRDRHRPDRHLRKRHRHSRSGAPPPGCVARSSANQTNGGCRALLGGGSGFSHSNLLPFPLGTSGRYFPTGLPCDVPRARSRVTGCPR